MHENTKQHVKKDYTYIIVVKTLITYLHTSRLITY